MAERSAALRASQARVIHQEKMAAFGLLAAGIAHEVGNPLAALSSLVQMLQRRGPDPYTSGKLDLADRQLGRIQRTIRELVDFARPASPTTGKVRLSEVVEEVLGVAKYYHRTGDRQITVDVAEDLPAILASRDHLIQVVLNLVFNAIDATGKAGDDPCGCRSKTEKGIRMTVSDDGRGVAGGGRPPPVPAVLHHQAAGDRPGSLCQPADRGGTGRDHRLPAGRGGREPLRSLLFRK